MPKFRSDLAFCREPVVGPHGFPLCGAPQPGTDESAVVRVPVDVLSIPVEIAGWLNVVANRAGGPTLESQVNLWNPRDLGEVESALKDRLTHVRNRGRLVFAHGLPVKSQPVTHLRNSICKVCTRASIPQYIPVNMYAEGRVQERLRRQRKSGTSVDCCLRHAELEVLGELEADLSAAEKRLGMQRVPVLSDCWACGAAESRDQKLLSRQLSDKSRQAYVPEITENQGNRNGLTRSMLNMLLSGGTLFVRIIALPSLGPHHKLRRPYESCQLARFMPT